jgi:predicted TIM-barrel fold metal-dependent hydrolase
VLIPLFPRLKISDPAFESAMCSATNAWQADTWLSKFNQHERYRGSIRICPFDPDGAVREIERWAGHPRMVQVQMFPESAAAYGQPQFRSVFTAAARHGLPVALHIIKQPSMRSMTPVGFPSYWLETFAQHPLLYFGHLVSLVLEGVFDAYPDLRVVCVEGGFSWLPPLMWRLDRYWQALGKEVPHVRRAPSEYLTEHVRLTTQPLDEGFHLPAMHQMMEWMDAGRMLMLATDYPHYDMDVPEWTAARVPRHIRQRVLCENAIELYHLPSTRRTDALDLPA